MGVALAVDIGGTKLAAALVDRRGTVVATTARSIPTPRDTDADALFRVLVGLVDVVIDASPYEIDVCGVGCGGPMAPGGDAVSPLNIPAWRRFPLQSRLAEHVQLPVFVDNDAKSLALGEGWVGAARGERDFIALVVSTGVGGGIVLDGRLLDGSLGNAGHIGHVIVRPGGLLCACGARGCLEAEASGTAIRGFTRRAPEHAEVAVRQQTGRLVGRAVASVANLLDLRLAVVSGSVALGYGDVFFGAAQAELDRSACLDFSRGARIVPGALGPRGPLIGAAALGWRAVGVDIGIA